MVTAWSDQGAKLSVPPPAVLVLGQQSVAIARRVMVGLPGAQLYGLASRTKGTDIQFHNFGETLRDLFAQDRPIIGFCAAGILIRTLAPLLMDKRQEPPVLAVAEDGRAVVPLLGGLRGVNTLARTVAETLGIEPAITTTGDLRFGVTLEDPPAGYVLANPEHAKTFMADLLAGATVRLEGSAPWLRLSDLPFSSTAEHSIQISEYVLPFAPKQLVYHPTTLAIGISGVQNCDVEEAIESIHALLFEHRLSPQAIALVVTNYLDAASPKVPQLAQGLNVPLRLLSPSPPPTLGAAALALTATGTRGHLVGQSQLGAFACAIARSAQPLNPSQVGQAQGQLAILGTGPGGAGWLSPQAKAMVQGASDLVGYTRYLDMLGPLGHGKKRHDSDNRQELDRARYALDLAAMGRSVALVSSGDPGIFAMAAAVFEVLERDVNPLWQSVQIQVSPGISAMQAAAARMGAPLGHDFCVISLSDLLKPWQVIEQRLRSAGQGDFVLAIYNPVSRNRSWQLGRAQEILLETGRSPQTPVILARNVGRPGESLQVLTLAELSPALVDMRTIVLVGSSKTRTIPRAAGGVWVYTPRFYEDVE